MAETFQKFMVESFQKFSAESFQKFSAETFQKFAASIKSLEVQLGRVTTSMNIFSKSDYFYEKNVIISDYFYKKLRSSVRPSDYFYEYIVKK